MDASDLAIAAYRIAFDMRSNIHFNPIIGGSPPPGAAAYSHLHCSCEINDPFPSPDDLYQIYLKPMAKALARAVEHLALDGTDATVPVPGTVGFGLIDTPYAGNHLIVRGPIISYASIDNAIIRATAARTAGHKTLLVFDGLFTKW